MVSFFRMSLICMSKGYVNTHTYKCAYYVHMYVRMYREC